MAKYPEMVLAAVDCVKPAVDEFYTWPVGTYVPTRFPNSSESVLHSLVTGEIFPLTPNDKTLETLRLIGSLVEHDSLFIVYFEDKDSVTLRGFVNYFPDSFDPIKIMNFKLREIHKPAPK
ncbi:hypothetical protein N7495_008719 [Penicillium taxi]|uniref:uncharacterized protein n=1 Tax=Penicillium taxi TaxID=168475 RepID=UPI002544D487|nr:uncharacterized protein N7495_008719 [Penicillium taxi]KAJ5888678.1 hypothetical protein N7495_008719 [Penicillium taxi]